MHDVAVSRSFTHGFVHDMQKYVIQVKISKGEMDINHSSSNAVSKKRLENNI